MSSQVTKVVIPCILVMLLLTALGALACQPTPILPQEPSPPSESSSPSEEELTNGLYEPEKPYDICQNGIDYNNPELYLTPGSQTKLSEQHLNEVSAEITIENNDIESIGTIFNWKEYYFTTYSAGGKFIGKKTVNQIMEEQALSGCHDHGLVLVSVLREYGFPAIMVDTAGIQWALDYSSGKRQDFRGHVFIEVYLENKWILLNSTSGYYISNYDPCNPVIPITDSVESKGYFALLKGLDPEGYGIDSNERLTEYLQEFASNIESIEMHIPQCEIRSLVK